MADPKGQNSRDLVMLIIVGTLAGGALFVSLLVIRDTTDQVALAKLKLATGYALLIFLFVLSMIVLLDIARGKIDLSSMLEELSGGASLSRFQLLVFTFVIAFSFFVVVAGNEKFPDVPANVLALLGVSASTYAVGKGLQIAAGGTADASDDSETSEPNEPQSPPTPPSQTPPSTSPASEGASQTGMSTPPVRPVQGQAAPKSFNI